MKLTIKILTGQPVCWNPIHPKHAITTSDHLGREDTTGLQYSLLQSRLHLDISNLSFLGDHKEQLSFSHELTFSCGP